MSIVSDPVLVDDVRRELADPLANGRVRTTRIRRFRDAGLIVAPLVLAALDGALTRRIGQAATLALCGVAIVAFVGRALLPSRGRQQPTDADLLRLVERAERCEGCGRLVLPEDGGECLGCGHLVNSRRAVLLAAAFVVVMILLALRRIGLLG